LDLGTATRRNENPHQALVAKLRGTIPIHVKRHLFQEAHWHKGMELYILVPKDK
jgi:hypothetical protein